MAENDIYDSKNKYEQFRKNLADLTQPGPKRTYICKNPANIKYAEKLCLHFEAQDASYVRRLRVLQVLKIILDQTTKDLKECNRENIDKIVAYVNSFQGTKTTSDFKRTQMHSYSYLSNLMMKVEVSC